MKPKGVKSVSGFYVLVKPEKIEEVSKGGIITVASEYQKKLEQASIYIGEIVAIGDSAWYDYTHKYGKQIFARWAEVGDRVLYTKHGGRHVEIPGDDGEEDYVIVRDGDILLVLENKK